MKEKNLFKNTFVGVHSFLKLSCSFVSNVLLLSVLRSPFSARSYSYFPCVFLSTVSRLFYSWLWNGLCGTVSRSSMHWSAEVGGLSAGNVIDEQELLDLSAPLCY